jgi:hypothetical protein
MAVYAQASAASGSGHGDARLCFAHERLSSEPCTGEHRTRGALVRAVDVSASRASASAPWSRGSERRTRGVMRETHWAHRRPSPTMPWCDSPG